MSYKIKIPLFEGPFDLLLFFIERDEIDIKDIPIATITKDFLDYIENLESMNIEVASEFFKLLLDENKIKNAIAKINDGRRRNEVDPRDELVKHLLEYKKFKSVVEDFKTLKNIEVKNILEEICMMK